MNDFDYFDYYYYNYLTNKLNIPPLNENYIYYDILDTKNYIPYISPSYDDFEDPLYEKTHMIYTHVHEHNSWLVYSTDLELISRIIDPLKKYYEIDIQICFYSPLELNIIKKFIRCCEYFDVEEIKNIYFFFKIKEEILMKSLISAVVKNYISDEVKIKLVELLYKLKPDFILQTSIDFWEFYGDCRKLTMEYFWTLTPAIKRLIDLCSNKTDFINLFFRYYKYMHSVMKYTLQTYFLEIDNQEIEVILLYGADIFVTYFRHMNIKKNININSIQYPLHIVNSNSHDLIKTCAICFMRSYYMTQCNHYFCGRCLESHRRISNKCKKCNVLFSVVYELP